MKGRASMEARPFLVRAKAQPWVRASFLRATRAAAAAPNRMTTGGAGTGTPPVDPPVELVVVPPVEVLVLLDVLVVVPPKLDDVLVDTLPLELEEVEVDTLPLELDEVDVDTFPLELEEVDTF